MEAGTLEAIIGIAVFVIGYAVIAFEHPLKINKAAPALLTGVIIWTVHMIFSGSADISLGHHSEHTAGISSILFFIMAAMTIVELMDAYGGFEIITERIKTGNLRSLLWIIGVATFFLSAILDNMTTAIIMCTLSSKIFDRQDTRWTFVGIIVIAANAGGAWSPIGDVTTIMLWVGGQITTWNIMASLFLPSLIALVIPLAWFHMQMKNSAVVLPTMKNTGKEIGVSKSEQLTVFMLGLLALLSVPVFKSLTHLPPYMGAMLGIGILWIYTESIHKHKEEQEEDGQFRIKATLQRIDHSSILFFLGILLAVAGLE